jgi:hypothetical protein
MNALFEIREYVEDERSPFAGWFDGFGPGCRVYFGRDGKTIILLLGGGSKRRQDANISAAIARWQRYQQAKKEKQHGSDTRI